MSLYWLSSHEASVVKIQTRKGLKRTLFIMTKHSTQTSRVCPFLKLQNSTALLSLCREICFLALISYIKTLNTINNKTSTTQ